MPPEKKASTRKLQPPAQNAQMEALLTQFGDLLEQSGQVPLGETAALLKSFAQHQFDDSPAAIAHDEAQQLAFDAMDAPTRAKQIALFRKCLRIDPDCVDALAGLANLTAKSPHEEIAGLEQAIQAGERFFGPGFSTANQGHFWSLIDTRPYMRARHRLATLLYAHDRSGDAIAHFEALLTLNPHDNQGVREELLDAYLATADLPKTRGLIKRYDEDESAVFQWSRVLERFLSDDLPGAQLALRAARKTNRFMEAFLTGKRRLRATLPDSYAMGSADEAILCLDVLQRSWAAHPTAIRWLVAALHEPSPTPAKKSRKKL